MDQFLSFLSGSIVGPVLYLRMGHGAMLVPGLILFSLVLLDRFGWNRALSQIGLPEGEATPDRA